MAFFASIKKKFAKGKKTKTDADAPSTTTGSPFYESVIIKFK